MSYSIQSGKTVDEAIQKALDELRISRDQADIEVIEEPSKGFLGLIGGKDAIVKVSEKFESKDILDSIFDPLTIEHKQENKEEVKRQSNMKEEETSQENLLDKAQEDKSLAKEEVEQENTAEEKQEEVSEEPNLEGIDSEEKQEITDISKEEKDAIIQEYIGKVMNSLSMDYSLKIEHKDRTIFVTIDGNKEETGIIIGKRGSTLDSIQYILSLILNSKTDVYNRVILDCSNYREKREATLKSLAHKMAKKALSSNRSVRLEPMPPHERRIIHAALGSFEGVSTHSEGKEPYRRVVIQKERRD